MRHFVIKDLENLTNIKAHTIRIWEERFKLFTPTRTSGNFRLYSLDDLKRLFTISLLIELGIKISKVITLTREEIEQNIQSISDVRIRRLNVIYKLILSIFSLQKQEFEEILNSNVNEAGLHSTIIEIIIPFLEKLNLLDEEENPVVIAAAANLVKKKLVVGIEELNEQADAAIEVILFLPKGAHHDVILLYLKYLLKKKGYKSLYLTNVSHHELETVITLRKPTHFITFIASKHQMAKISEYANILRQHNYTLMVVVNDPEKYDNTDATNFKIIKYTSVLDAIHT
jgi:MerR family transcriptional regulator, light-induced transcriptional regulator